MRPKLAATVVLTLTVLACGAPPSMGVAPFSPPPTPAVSPLIPPTQALVPWAGFPADHVPRPVVLIGNAGPASGFSTFEAKLAALCHKFRSGITLSTTIPARAHVTWTTSGATADYPAISAAAALAAMTRPLADTSDPNCATAQPLVVNGSLFGTFDFETDRGNAQISAWLFTASGFTGEAAYPALATSAFWNGGIVNGSSNGGSSVSADGRTLTFNFYGAPNTSGPCGADYKGLVAESSSAVAVVVQASPHASPGQPIACDAIAQQRSVTVALAAPLGGRVVVDSSSAAVAVCPETLPNVC